jgi:hypothetical protein
LNRIGKVSIHCQIYMEVVDFYIRHGCLRRERERNYIKSVRDDEPVCLFVKDKHILLNFLVILAQSSSIEYKLHWYGQLCICAFQTRVHLNGKMSYHLLLLLLDSFNRFYMCLFVTTWYLKISWCVCVNVHVMQTCNLNLDIRRTKCVGITWHSFDGIWKLTEVAKIKQSKIKTKI